MATTSTITDLIKRLERAVERATQAWTGLDWDTSAFQTAAERVARHERVDLDELTSQFRDDGGHEAQRHRARIRAVRGRIEDEIDDDTSDDVRSEIVDQLIALADEEEASVEAEAEEAAACGARAVALAQAGDYRGAAQAAHEAVSVEMYYGDAPAWRAVERLADELLEAATDDEDDAS